jgi:hypothetical protein
MLKCSQCRQYYVPGFLDCYCRTRQSLSLPPAEPLSSPGQVVVTHPQTVELIPKTVSAPTSSEILSERLLVSCPA